MLTFKCNHLRAFETICFSRLLNLDVDVWVHLNCALWSLEVYETLNGALMNVDVAVKRGTVTVGVAALSSLCYLIHQRTLLV